MTTFPVGAKARIIAGYQAYYDTWSRMEQNRLYGRPVFTMARDGEIVTILDNHVAEGDTMCMIKAPGLGGSVHSAWLEIIENKGE